MGGTGVTRPSPFDTINTTHRSYFLYGYGHTGT